MTGAEAVARILELEGVRVISCFPETPLIDPCAALGIRPVVARSERVVVNIADGFSRAATTRSPARSKTASPTARRRGRPTRRRRSGR